MSHLEFVFKVGKHSQSSQQRSSSTHSGIVYCQTIKAVYFYIRQMLRTHANLLYALLHGKQGRFVGIEQKRDNHPLKELATPLYNVEVPQGNRIEAAWINCNHTGKP